MQDRRWKMEMIRNWVLFSDQVCFKQCSPVLDSRVLMELDSPEIKRKERTISYSPNVTQKARYRDWGNCLLVRNVWRLRLKKIKRYSIFFFKKWEKITRSRGTNLPWMFNFEPARLQKETTRTDLRKGKCFGCLKRKRKWRTSGRVFIPGGHTLRL